MAAGPGICSLILKIKPSNSTFSISIEGDIFTSDYPTSYSETSSDFSVSGEYLTKTYAIGPGYGHTISIQYNNKTITERVSPLSDDSTHTMIIDLSLYDNITLTRDESKDLIDCVAVKYSVQGPIVCNTYAWKSSNGEKIYTLCDETNKDDYILVFDKNGNIICDLYNYICYGYGYGPDYDAEEDEERYYIGNIDNQFCVINNNKYYYRDSISDDYYYSLGYNNVKDVLQINETTNIDISLQHQGTITLVMNPYSVKSGEYKVYNAIDEYLGSFNTATSTYSIEIDKSKLIGNTVFFRDDEYDWVASSAEDNCEIYTDYFTDHPKYNWAIRIIDISQPTATFLMDNND